MEDLTKDDIDYLRKILKIKPKDSAKKIDINFENNSVKFHSSVRPMPKFEAHFEKMVIAREFLKHMALNKEMTVENVISNWNTSEKNRVENLIVTYKRMSRKEYEKAIEVEFVALSVLKIFFFVFLGLSTAIGLSIVFYLLISGTMVVLGIIVLIFIALVIIAYILRGTGRENIRRQKYIWRRKY